MKLLTKWLQWFDKAREEYRFHCDLILAPDEYITIKVFSDTGESRKKSLLILGKDEFVKVHLSASWEFRETEFES